MKIDTGNFVRNAKLEMQNQYARTFLSLLPPYIAARRVKVMGSFPDPAAAQELSRAIRAEAVARMPDLLEEFEKNAIAAGARVLWARNAAEANEMILSIARERNVTMVTKGKSMISEETGLNDALAREGIEPFETDLGEFIAQQLGRPPFHIVGPAINVPVEEVCDLFMKKAGMQEETTDPVELGYAARLFLRDKFRRARLGITGVNMAVADTGAIINVENEGNIRFNKSSPRTQVSVMSPEKVVPTTTDALHLLRVLCRNCTGQSISAYVSIDRGPREPAEIDGPEELFIIIVDNGRSRLYHDPKLREALRCIRCGACLNLCPVYAKIGGYPYGWAYSGPMGQVLNPALLGLEETGDLFKACTLCGTCREVCPAGIDHPAIFLHYRALEVKRKRRSSGRWEAILFGVWGTAAAHSAVWRFLYRLARPVLAVFGKKGKIEAMPGPFAGWFGARDLPVPARRTFRDQWRESLSKQGGAS
ncbi:MAG TPA: lactate utilization protein [Deltaproteobacteria bacterium]|nr:lactate utilization protein [Deltaproteobacteria bacterium]